MKVILDEMLAALSRGERVVLCSILASSGSVPRGAGAKMAVLEDGRVLGTIGGGAVERLSIERARRALNDGCSNELRSYNLHPSEVAGTGMICGGAVTVYFQLFSPEQTENITVLRRWRDLLDRDVDLWLLLSLDGDSISEFHVVTRGEIPQDRAGDFSTKAVWKNGVYVEPLRLAGSVYIFGGGHVGHATVGALSRVGFDCTLFDCRPEFAQSELHPGAHKVILGDYQDIAASLTFDEHDYVFIMSHSHKFDYAILEQALRQTLAYVGFMGSRRKIAIARDLMHKAGIPDEVVDTVHMPIGLEIEAETPEEIAVSVAAECILHRATH